MQTWGKGQGGFINFFFSSISSSTLFCPSFRFWPSECLLTMQYITGALIYFVKWWSQWIRGISELSRPVELEFHYLNNKNESEVWNPDYLETCNCKDLIILPIAAASSMTGLGNFYSSPRHFIPAPSNLFSGSLNRALLFSRTSRSQQLCFAPISNTVIIMSQYPYSSSPLTREALVLGKCLRIKTTFPYLPCS